MGSGMMKAWRAIIVAAAVAALAGCAAGPSPHSQSAILTTQLQSDIAPAPPQDPRSLLTLDQISPPPRFPDAPPQTQPSGPPPIESLALYAAARDAMFDHQPDTAVRFLNQAIKLDSDSFELYRSLGEALLSQDQRPTAQSVAAFEHAVALHPGDLRLRALLGSQYATLGDFDRAMYHLRLAMETPQYQSDDVAASAVDLLLARLLQQQGFDRASLDQYQVLLHRLATAGPDLRDDPELGLLVSDPTLLFVDIARLFEKAGRWDLALRAYGRSAEADPSNFELQSKVVQMLRNLGRTDEAVRKAADVVMRFDASSDSMQLLRSVLQNRGGNASVADVLLKLHAQRPGDHAILFALVEALKDQDRQDQAESLLREAAAADPVDDDLARKLLDLYLQRNDVSDAARLLTLHIAANPDSTGEFSGYWDELQRPLRTNALRLSTLQMIEVPPAARAAKLYLESELAQEWKRDALERSTLQQAVAIEPPFAPAYRQEVINIWGRPDWDDAQKQEGCECLARTAEAAGDAALAAEVRGLSDQQQGKFDAALARFNDANQLGDHSPELELTEAAVDEHDKEDSRAEQILWRLVSDHSQYDSAWSALFELYLQNQSPDEARKVLVQWLNANPGSIDARVLQAEVTAQEGDLSSAQDLLLKLFNDHPDSDDVIAALVAIYRRADQLDPFIVRLEDMRSRHPSNRTVVQWLVELYAREGRTAEADRVLDQTRAAVGNDPDLLYQLAHLYDLLDQKGACEDVLQQVVALDPSHAGASNDLGYTWADEGRNLDKAEALIRVAVAAEPDNQSFLDSLGWVLYKRGKFAESAENLQMAIGPAALPDPVVLDHYGDVLWRLGEWNAAVKQWQRSLDRLDQEDGDREDLKQLRLELITKLDAQRQGRTVDPAPLGATTRPSNPTTRPVAIQTNTTQMDPSRTDTTQR